MSPHWTSAQVEAQVPTRMKVSAPHLWSSSTQMAVEGPPIPVEVTVTRSPSSVPSDGELPLPGHHAGVVQVGGDQLAPVRIPGTMA